MKKAGKKIVAIVMAITTLFICLFSSACSSVSRFAIVYNGEYIYSDKKGVKIRDSATFQIKPYGGDDYIEATATAISLSKQDDYSFMINNRKYKWNQLVDLGMANVGKYVSITIDQDANTVTISNTTVDTILSYAKEHHGTDNVVFNQMPTVDMFRIDITVGESKTSLFCSLLHNVQSIELKPISNKNLQVE